MWFENEWVRKGMMVLAVMPLLLVGAAFRRDAKLKVSNEKWGRQLQFLAGANLVLLIAGDFLSDTLGNASYLYALLVVIFINLLFFVLHAWLAQKQGKKKS